MMARCDGTMAWTAPPEIGFILITPSPTTRSVTRHPDFFEHWFERFVQNSPDSSPFSYPGLARPIRLLEIDLACMVFFLLIGISDLRIHAIGGIMQLLLQVREMMDEDRGSSLKCLI